MEPLLKFNKSKSYHGTPENIPENYSFGEEVYNDFIQRSDDIKNSLNLDGKINYYMEGILKKNNENLQYILETTIKPNRSFSPNLFTIINFLSDMINNPNKILSNKNYQNNFKKSVSSLKKYEIKINTIFNLKDKFQKNYEFNEYLFYNPEENIIRYHEWETKKEFNDPKLASKKYFINLADLNETLLELNKHNLLKINYKIISEIKENYRNQLQGLEIKNGNKKDVEYYRKLVQEGKKSSNPVLLISKDLNFEGIIKSLDKDKIINYFPFDSKLNKNFIAKILRNNFKTK